MATLNTARLRELVDAAGRTPRSVSLDVGDNAYLVRDLLSGRSRSPRTDTLLKLAATLGVEPSELLTSGVDEPGVKFKSPKGRPTEIRLPIRYEVAASGFLERDELPQRPYGFHTVPSVAPYAGAPQWLERVVSDSMDLLLPVGSLVHVVDTIALEYEPRHGDVVIVERSRAQGALVERTIKQVALTPAGPELWPRSHNPRHQQAIALHDGDERSDDVTVQIVGKVIRSYMFFEPEAEEPEVA